MAKLHKTETGKSESPGKSDSYWGRWLQLDAPKTSTQNNLDEHNLWKLALNAAILQIEHSK
jgi:hypothetical protein